MIYCTFSKQPELFENADLLVNMCDCDDGFNQSSEVVKHNSSLQNSEAANQ